MVSNCDCLTYFERAALGGDAKTSRFAGQAQDYCLCAHHIGQIRIQRSVHFTRERHVPVTETKKNARKTTRFYHSRRGHLVEGWTVAHPGLPVALGAKQFQDFDEARSCLLDMPRTGALGGMFGRSGVYAKR